MNRCPDARALLPAYVENELNPVEAMRVKGHLDLCSACRREETAFRAAMGALNGAPKPEHGDLCAGLSARLDALERRPVLRPAKLRWAGGLACLLLAAGVGATVVTRTFFTEAPEAPTHAALKPNVTPDTPKVASNASKPSPVASGSVEDPFEPDAVAPPDKPEPNPVYDPGEENNASSRQPQRDEPFERRRSKAPKDESWRFAKDIRDVRAANGDTVEDIMKRLQRDGRYSTGSKTTAPVAASSTTQGSEVETPRELPVRTVTDPHLPDVVVLAPEPEKKEKLGEKIVRSSRAEGFDKEGKLALIRLTAEAAPAAHEKAPIRRGTAVEDN